MSILLLPFLAMPVFSAGEESSGNLNFNVEGRAVINQNDFAGARDEAIANALLDAVLSAAAKILSIDVTDRRLETVSNYLGGKQDKYVKNYKITAERNQAELYLVNANVTVAFSALKGDLHKIGIVQSAKAGISSIIVSLNIKGLKKYSDFSQLREFLKSKTRIVKNIYPRSFEWGQADLAVEISGTAQVLADELAGTGRYVLDTKQIYGSQINITFLQRGGE
jgi:hypothetical protein